MFLNDSVGHCQAEARTTADAFGGEEWIVNLGNVLRRYSHAAVCDFDQQRLVIVSSARGQGDAAVAVGDRIARVENQVRKHLLQLNRVAMNRRQVLCIVAHNLDIAAAQLWFEQLQRVVEDPVNVDSGKLSRAARAREVQQIVDNVGGSLCLTPDL